jgi:hypothetical protein
MHDNLYCLLSPYAIYSSFYDPAKVGLFESHALKQIAMLVEYSSVER